MSFGSKILVGTTAGFLAVAYSWIFRAKKVHSERDAGEDDAERSAETGGH